MPAIAAIALLLLLSFLSSLLVYRHDLPGKKETATTTDGPTRFHWTVGSRPEL